MKKQYVILYIVDGEEKQLFFSSEIDNRDVLLNVALIQLNELMEASGITKYRFVNVVDAEYLEDIKS